MSCLGCDERMKLVDGVHYSERGEVMFYCTDNDMRNKKADSTLPDFLIQLAIMVFLLLTASLLF